MSERLPKIDADVPMPMVSSLRRRRREVARLRRLLAHAVYDRPCVMAPGGECGECWVCEARAVLREESR